MLVRDKINAIALILYARMGYQQKPGYDFEVAHHPQERMCFDMACLAWEEILGDSPDFDSDLDDASTIDWTTVEDMLEESPIRKD